MSEIIIVSNPTNPAEEPPLIAHQKGRLLLIETLCWCLLAIHTILWNWPWGLGTTITIFFWYLLIFSALGTKSLKKKENWVLFIINIALGLSFALKSNTWFRGWNFIALLILIPIHMFSLASETILPWWRPKMFWERFCLLLTGWFGYLPVSLKMLTPSKETGESGHNKKRTLAIIIGTITAVLLLTILLPVLASADALFAVATKELRSYSQEHFMAGFVQFIWALVLTPFLFGWIYMLCCPKLLKLKSIEKPFKSLDNLLFLLILAALDILYLLFLLVQSVGLFGGPVYLEQYGISYAEWARSGFFQMTGVTIVNLSVLLTAMSWANQHGNSWTVLKILSIILTGESALLLASAAWRMYLYILTYGLSFKRCMTCWGMMMMAIFFLIALKKILKPSFSFCRVAFPVAIAGWLLINCIPIDYLTAKDHIDRYLSETRNSLSIGYLCQLSYDAVPQLKRLKNQTILADGGIAISMDQILSARQESAQEECSHWQTWNLSAWLQSR